MESKQLYGVWTFSCSPFTVTFALHFGFRLFLFLFALFSFAEFVKLSG